MLNARANDSPPPPRGNKPSNDTANNVRELQLELLTEHDSVPWDALPGLMVEDEHGEFRLAQRPERLPASFTLVARRPAAAGSR